MSAPRPQAWRLDPAPYPFTCAVAPRFGDIDALRHLNNVALAAIYEEGRIAMHRQVDFDGLREPQTRTVIGQVLIHYLGEGFYPEPLIVACGVSRIGEASYEIAQALFQGGRCIGAADTVIVQTLERRAHPLNQAMKGALAGLALRAPGGDPT